MRMQSKALAGVILLAGFIAGLVVSGRMSATQPVFSEPPAPQSSAAPAGKGTAVAANGVLPDLSSVAERALKAAANISSTSVTVVDDPWTRFFYGRDLAQRSQSLGSGVVVSPDGYVLTNTHVIGNARADIRVTLSDGKEQRGTLVGLDAVTDLAVVKIPGRDLATLPFGDSSKLRVAEWVLAIGNPFNLSGTVTLGIVSNTRRSGSQVGTYRDLIQTDAAINQGNSGGALVNARGELVGINSMIYSENGGFVGIGFAIPSNVARDIMKELIAHGEVRYGSIGEERIQWRAVSREVARENGLGDVGGLMVWSLMRNSSAYRSGLRPGDVVIAINGQPATDPDQISRIVIGSAINSTVKLDVFRDGRRITLDVRVEAR
jgi:S1-C subfamily serine protease